MWGDVVSVQDLCQLAVVVLHAMPLIDDHVLPVDLAQDRLVLDDVFVGGQQDVQLPQLDLVLVAFPDGWLAFVWNRNYCWSL